VPPSCWGNRGYLGPHKSTTNGTLIGSSVSAQLTVVTNRQTDTQIYHVTTVTLGRMAMRTDNKVSSRGRRGETISPADGCSTVAYRFAANQAICVSPWIQKSRRIYVRPRTGPQSAHLWWPAVAKLQAASVPTI